DGTNKILLNPGDASHSMNLSPSANYLVDNWSRADQAPRSMVFDNFGNKIMDLEETDLSRLLATGWKFPEIFTAKAEDGVIDLWGGMYRPFDFDPTKKYAVVDYVYPGPFMEGPSYGFSSSSSNQTLANLGFIAVSVGNRGGSPNRSAYYHSYGYKNARDYGLADQKFAIEQLGIKYPYVDVERVGIHGHSGGGFMSTAAV
ncbi:MAG: prolyl oligopeptidase family serine peptidase, partial [Planctomycetes bacterium]|nr:prolyl oligopeptidase family serine peptidase [Planctomycetota bacterium]